MVLLLGILGYRPLSSTRVEKSPSVGSSVISVKVGWIATIGCRFLFGNPVIVVVAESVDGVLSVVVGGGSGFVAAIAIAAARSCSRMAVSQIDRCIYVVVECVSAFCASRNSSKTSTRDGGAKPPPLLLLPLFVVSAALAGGGGGGTGVSGHRLFVRGGGF
jgi:hypothetical protein